MDSRRVLCNLPRAFKDPGWAMVMLSREVLPFPIFTKDPEARRIGSWAFGSLPRRTLAEVVPGIEEISVNLLRPFDRAVGTSLDVQEVVALCSMARYVQARKILEIGTSDGNTALNLAANSPPDAAVVTVDLPPQWDGELAAPVPAPYVNVTERAKVGGQFKNTPYESKIRQVFADSAALDFSKLGGPFDLAFIDGCHFREYVRKDTESALGHLRPGGLLVWHDYGAIKDVSQVVDEMARTMRVEVIQGTRLALGFPDSVA